MDTRRSTGEWPCWSITTKRSKPLRWSLIVDPGAEHVATQTAIARLVELYERWNEPDKARTYRTLLPADVPGE